MQEVASLDSKLRQLEKEAEVLREVNQSLLRERDAAGLAAKAQRRMLLAMEESLEQARAEHTSEREYLSGIFRELEAQLALARTEREELQSRSESECCAAARRHRKLEEEVARLKSEGHRVRAEGQVRCRGMSQAFERQLAALRLHHEEALADKGLLRQLERDMAELREIGACMLEREPRAAFDGDSTSHCGGITGHGVARRGRGLASRAA
jgi:hypothetical protein